MTNETCGICVLRREHSMYIEGVSGDCLRPYTHVGVHLFLNARGEYIIWEDDNECGCCEPEDHDRCFTYRRATPEEVTTLLTSIEGILL